MDSSQMPLKTVLLVDDVDASRIMAKWFLSNFGYEVESVRTAEEALALFNPRVHDAVITDNTMPCLTGAEMAHIIKLRSPATPVIMFSGSPPEDRSCLDVVIQKPAHLMTLKDALDTLFGGTGTEPNQSHRE
jgi:CheY-like chemotaxis protein